MGNNPYVKALGWLAVGLAGVGFFIFLSAVGAQYYDSVVRGWWAGTFVGMGGSLGVGWLFTKAIIFAIYDSKNPNTTGIQDPAVALGAQQPTHQNRAPSIWDGGANPTEMPVVGENTSLKTETAPRGLTELFNREGSLELFMGDDARAYDLVPRTLEQHGTNLPQLRARNGGEVRELTLGEKIRLGLQDQR